MALVMTKIPWHLDIMGDHGFRAVPGTGCRVSLGDTSWPLTLCSLDVMGQLHSPCSRPIYVSLSPDKRFPATPERVRPTLGPCVQSESIKT